MPVCVVEASVVLMNAGGEGAAFEKGQKAYAERQTEMQMQMNKTRRIGSPALVLIYCTAEANQENAAKFSRR
jgi:hypothetical protein